MLNERQRTTILELFAQGTSRRQIARTLKLSRKAVKAVIASDSTQVPRVPRVSRVDEHRTLIRELYTSCRGNLVRVHEELVAATGHELSYTALTAFCRKQGIGHKPVRVSGEYHFGPGQELQHDTSPHRVKLGGRERLVQTASAALCYSRMLFFQFYPAFTRFECKLFLADAHAYFGGSTEVVLVDNTSVVRCAGTGRHMVPAPEMAAFAERYGYEFRAHAVGHADRKPHVEAPFRFIERNFLAGREFKDFAEANAQARAWCDKVNRSYKKHIRAVPNELFAAERVHLRPLPAYVPEVYRLHHRVVDVYGYVSLHTNRYSVPAEWVARTLEVLEYKDRLEISDGRSSVRHARLEEPAGRSQRLPEHRYSRPRPTREGQPSREEQRLAEIAPDLLDYARALKQRGRKQPTLALRQLLRLLDEYPHQAVREALAEAAHYGLFDLERVERMVLRRVAHDFFPAKDDDHE
jgi:predicted transcriptional regulator